jgi:hypothetical protein
LIRLADELEAGEEGGGAEKKKAHHLLGEFGEWPGARVKRLVTATSRQ